MIQRKPWKGYRWECPSSGLNEACKLAKVKEVKLYVGTKHSTLSRLGRKYTDSQLIKPSGHTNTKTIRRYSQSSLKDVRKMIQES